MEATLVERSTRLQKTALTKSKLPIVLPEVLSSQRKPDKICTFSKSHSNITTLKYRLNELEKYNKYYNINVGYLGVIL